MVARRATYPQLLHHRSGHSGWSACGRDMIAPTLEHRCRSRERGEKSVAPSGRPHKPRDRAAVGTQVRPGVRQPDPAAAAPRRRQVAPYVDGLGTQHLSYLSHANGSGVGERALSDHGHRTATLPAFSAFSPRAYASSFLAPRPRPSPACVTVRCHSGGAGVEGTRHAHVSSSEAGSLCTVLLVSSPFEAASALREAVIGVDGRSGQLRPYVRPVARRSPLATMGVRLRARHQSRRRARGTVPLSVSPAPS